MKYGGLEKTEWFSVLKVTAAILAFVALVIGFSQ
jgi:hypothetical protein